MAAGSHQPELSAQSRTAAAHSPRAPSTLPPSQAAIVAQLEEIFTSIFTDLSVSHDLTIPVRSRPRLHRHFTSQHPPDLPLPTSTHPPSRYTYPSHVLSSAHRFAAALRILDIIHRALLTSTPTTKRNIYYADPALFGSQRIVDRFVDDLAYTLGVQRCALNVVAASKGLVAGPLRIERGDGTLLDCSAEAGGVLVPTLSAGKESGDRLLLDDVDWVLVVEKEATWRALVEGWLFRDHMVGRDGRRGGRARGLLVTAKGYPDVLTRSFLRTIHEADRILPFYALVDWDPDGVAIFLTYKHGSAALAHENHALRVPSMECLGVKSEDLLGGEWKVDEHSGEVGRELGGVIRPKDTESGGRSSIELVTLTTRDRSKAVSTLKRAAEGGDVGEASWVRELQVMLMLGFKAELQALDTGNDRLQTWLEQKLGPRET